MLKIFNLKHKGEEFHCLFFYFSSMVSICGVEMFARNMHDFFPR